MFLVLSAGVKTLWDVRILFLVLFYHIDEFVGIVSEFNILDHFRDMILKLLHFGNLRRCSFRLQTICRCLLFVVSLKAEMCFPTHLLDNGNISALQVMVLSALKSLTSLQKEIVVRAALPF